MSRDVSSLDVSRFLTFAFFFPRSVAAAAVAAPAANKNAAAAPAANKKKGGANKKVAAAKNNAVVVAAATTVEAGELINSPPAFPLSSLSLTHVLLFSYFSAAAADSTVVDAAGELRSQLSSCSHSSLILFLFTGSFRSAADTTTTTAANDCPALHQHRCAKK